MQVQLLGPVLLRGVDGEVALGRPQQRCVFAALAMTPGQTVPVDTLVERVWGAQPPRNGRTALYSYISRLRAVLRAADPEGPAALRRRAGGYALDIDPDCVDLHRSRRLAGEARAAAAAGDPARAAALSAQACALWPMPDPPLGGVSGDWAARARTGLEHERLGLLVERYDTAIRAGQHDAVVGELSEVLAAHPLTESLAGLLMLALYRSGSHADALEVYSTLRRRMVEELGDEPGAALRRLHEQVLRRDPELDLTLPPGPAAGPDADDTAHLPAPWVSLCQLPPAVSLVGRDGAVDTLVSTFASPGDGRTVPVMAVTGPPGVGKTAVAVAAAHQLRDAFPDGQWFVRLGSATPEQVLAELLEAAGMDSGVIPDGLDRRAAALRARLAGRRVLLLLDAADGSSQVRPLLPGTPGPAVLVTSRNRLAGLAEAAPVIHLGPLPPADAFALVSNIAGADRVNREPAATAELCGWCAGMPLALRIAAARLAAHPSWPVQRFAARLRDHRQRLDELAVDDLAIRPGLDLSYQALEGTAQQALRNAAALGNQPLAPWAWGALAGDRVDGSRLADTLCEASLLECLGVDATGEPRYRLHDLVATYAEERAEEHPEQVARAGHRQLATLLALSDSAYRRLHVDTTDLPAAGMPDSGWPTVAPMSTSEVARLTADPVAWLLSERVPLVATINRASQQGWPGGAAALADRVLVHVLRVHIGPDEIRRHYEQIRDVARGQGESLVAWRAEARLCTELAVSGRISAAADGLMRCATAFEEMGADAELAFSLGAAATYHRYLGGGPELLPRAERALAVARGCGATVEVEATRQLAAMLAGLGRHGEALRLFGHALDLATSEGLIAHRTVTLIAMASAAYGHGELDQAEAACHRALELVDGTTDPRGVAYLLLLSARTAAARGHIHEAAEAAEDAAVWFADLGDTLGQALALSQLGRLRLDTGDASGAVPVLEQAANTLHSVGMYAAHTDTLSTLAHARAAAGTAERPVAAGAQ